MKITVCNYFWRRIQSDLSISSLKLDRFMFFNFVLIICLFKSRNHEFLIFCLSPWDVWGYLRKYLFERVHVKCRTPYHSSPRGSEFLDLRIFLSSSLRLQNQPRQRNWSRYLHFQETTLLHKAVDL